MIIKGNDKLVILGSTATEPKMYIATMGGYIKQLSEMNKSVIVVGDGFIYGIVNNKEYDVHMLENVLKESKEKKRDKKKDDGKKKKEMPFRINESIKSKEKGKKPEVIKGLSEVTGSFGNKQIIIKANK